MITCLEVCVAYRRGLDWWPNLWHTYTTCYYTSQTTIWHTISSPSLTAVSRDFLNFDSSYLRSALYSLRADPQKTTFLSFSQQFLYCYRGVPTSPLHRNGSYFPVSLFISAGICLPSRCLAVDVCSGPTIPSFRRHVTVFTTTRVTVFEQSKHVWPQRSTFGVMWQNSTNR
jgi:hypothetical protein